MTDVLFFSSVMKIREENEVYEICGGEQPKEGDAWDTVQADSSSLEYGEEMAYYDVTGGERGNNYFGSIKAGETKILHVGFVVDEDALPYLYLNTGTSGSSYTFTEQDLAQGLVDIRQEKGNSGKKESAPGNRIVGAVFRVPFRVMIESL